MLQIASTKIAVTGKEGLIYDTCTDNNDLVTSLEMEAEGELVSWMETLDEEELNMKQFSRYSPNECIRIVDGLIAQETERAKRSRIE